MDDFFTRYWQYIAAIPLVSVNLFAIVKSLAIMRRTFVEFYIKVITGLFFLIFLQILIAYVEEFVFDPYNKLTGKNSPTNISLFIYMVFEYFIYAYLLLIFIKSSFLKKYLKISIMIFLLIGNVLWFSQLSFVTVLSILSLMESLLLLIPGLYYFYEILNRPPVLQLSDEPPFWIVTGIVFLLICLIPVYIGVGIINMVGPIQILDYLGYIILILLFLKGVSCKTVRPGL